MSPVSLTVTVNRTIGGASPAEVFDALTAPGILQQWIAADATVDLEVDGAISFGWRGGGPLKITAVDPPSVFEYLWRFGDEPETVVRWELQGVPNGTTVTVVHSGFRNDAGRRDYERGWSERLELLEDVVTRRGLRVLTITPDEQITPAAPAATKRRDPVKVGNISLSTQDLDANRSFYVDWLGLPIKGDHEKMLVLEGNLVIDAAHGNPTTTGAHIMLVADDIDALAARASDRGIPCRKTPWGTLSTNDPDGRMVEVMAQARWAELAGD